jgi:hypothetical protein
MNYLASSERNYSDSIERACFERYRDTSGSRKALERRFYQEAWHNSQANEQSIPLAVTRCNL